MKKFLLILAMASPVLCFAQKKGEEPKVYDLLIGTYTRPNASKGISVYRFYEETGKVAYLNQIDGVSNPTYLTVSPDKKFVYSVNENKAGEVSAFKFDAPSGKLELINKQSAAGAGPAHIVLDKDSKNVIVSNYGAGSVTVLPVNKDGSLSPATQTIQDEGSSANKQRQEGPHAHSANFSPDGKYVFYADLGTDKVYINKYKANKVPPLTPADVPTESVKAGNGPRHMDFSKDGKYLYLIQEMSADINVYAYKNGKITFIQSVNMMPAGFTGRNGAADIHVSPDGLFIYGTNRGTANELLVYSINQQDGKLTYVDRYATGKEPRNFAITPTGSWLLVASQNSNNITVFKVDRTTGKLTPNGTTIDIGAPSCLKLVPVE
jgi:6-phosphogluconolactonase